MNRVALLCSEPIRASMGGIGVRYSEMAQRLPDYGIEAVLVTAGDLAAVPAGIIAGDRLRAFERGRLATLLSDCAAAIVQGDLANDVLRECPRLPVAIDVYDPFLIEHFSYAAALGLNQFRHDHATLRLQLSRGDLFLCASEEQRLFYLGFLAAVGRVNPLRVADDPDLTSLIAIVPFCVPDELPPYRPLLGERRPNERRLLFGGLYDWYDPWPVLEALRLLDRPDWTLLFVRNPNPAQTPQRLLSQVETWCRERGWLGTRVQLIDWAPIDRRFDLLRDVDAVVATHPPGIETRLSMRTRIIEAVACARPVITSEGGAMSALLQRHGVGWTVAPGDVPALVGALRQALEDGDPARIDGARAAHLLEGHSWRRALEPLVRFCREPVSDPTKDILAADHAGAGIAVGSRLRRLWGNR